ncbi:MAG: M20/M25/M40 family metallo-hydrolase [Sphingomonadales bacterium]
MKFVKTAVAGALALGLTAMPTNAETIEEEATGWLQEYLRVDTINPPGNETNAVNFFAAILEAEGIPYETVESAPGRGNIWARLEGGDKPALALTQHTDVVPADMEYWTVDPLSGELKDGYLYGRGAIDMKGGGMTQFAAFIALHRAGIPLNRDVLFVATADEEAGGLFGAGWLIENMPEIFEGVGTLLNESGSGTLSEDGSIVFDIEVTQKVPVWIRLSAVDTPGHGSTPRTTSAATRILDALQAIRENPFPPRIVPAVDHFFKGLAETVDEEYAVDYRDMAEAIKKEGYLPELQAESPWLHALTRDTCSITRFDASNKINVVSPAAWAEVDCRMLPDRPAAEFIADMRSLIEATGVELEVIMAFSPAVSSTDDILYQSMETVLGERYPDAKIIAGVSTGFTDSHFFRDLGIPSFGFTPTIFEEELYTGVHGNDERIKVDAYQQGVTDLIDILELVVYDQE